MVTILLVLILLLLVVAIGLQIYFSKTPVAPETTQLSAKLDALLQMQQRTEDVLRHDFQQSRTETATIARDGRDEVNASLAGGFELQQQSLHSFAGQLQTLSQGLTEQVERLRSGLDENIGTFRTQSTQSLAEGFDLQQKSLHAFAGQLQNLSQTLGEQNDKLRTGLSENFGSLRTQSAQSLDAFANLLLKQVADNANLQQQALQGFSANLQTHSKTLTEQLEQFKTSQAQGIKTFESATSLKLETTKEDAARSDSRLREEVTGSLKGLSDSIIQRLTEVAALQKAQLDTFAASIGTLRETLEGRFDTVRLAVEGKLKDIQEDNSKQLDQMRATVEEKLQGTLETRLGEAFKQVSERLDQVHKGLGEMQSLATGVGDLKRVLTNVKTRGGWGEVQLGALLEQMLTPDQFERNVRTKDDSQEAVEFAIKLPGSTGEKEDVVWLPVDSKFPIEDYQRLMIAQEAGDVAAAEEASKALAASVTNCAKLISTKYLNPPKTTDFGIMFLPTEGLFAEIIRRPGLMEKLQHEWRVAISGPTTFAALLNSLQMGFKTLTIQKQSSEVWKVLGAVKTEFSKFGGAIDAVKKKLDEASKKMDDVDVRTRAVNRRLKTVEAIEQPVAVGPLVVLAEGENGEEDDTE